VSPKKIARPLDIYVRVSDVKGRAGESFQSPKEQEERCRAALASRGLEAGKVFRELDVSGKSMERPELREVRERIEAGVSGGVVVARVDRLGRTVVGALEVIQEIDKAGGAIITAEGDFDTSTAVGELVLGMMLQLAQFELRRISETWQASKRNAVARGIHITRHLPPGYRRGPDGRLEPDGKHARTVSEAYKLAAQGTSPARIAEYLTERKLPSGDNLAPTWKSSRIRRLLANRAYLGEARANGEIVNANAHEPLTDESTWLQAQRKSKTPPVSIKSEYLLSGLVRCASCRASMKPQKASKWAVATFRCSGGSAAGNCPHPSTITMSKLDDVVLEQFVARALASEGEPREKQDDSEVLARIADARKAVQEVEALKGSLRPAVYAEALDAALGELEDAQQALTEQSSFDEQDVALLVNAALPLLSGDYKFDSVGMKTGREALAREIQTVFVRPPARRSKSLPISDRVRIVWRDEEPLELPTRGTAFAPRAYVW
jgi:site-specific DNA recombinase